jgi:hypothetical protein
MEHAEDLINKKKKRKKSCKGLSNLSAVLYRVK